MTNESYSRAGEDLLIGHLLGTTENVRYVDIGCLWPVDHSNTYLFYRNGGSGVCIDANPEVAEEYRAKRPRDVFLNVALGARPGTRTYYMFESPGLNTLSVSRAEWLMARASKRPGFKLRSTVEVPVTSLDAAFGMGDVPTRPDGRLDLMSIDVEGLELEVLSGFSFEPKPRLVICEQNVHRGKLSAGNLKLNRFMEERGYDQVAHTGHDVLFLARDM